MLDLYHTDGYSATDVIHEAVGPRYPLLGRESLLRTFLVWLPIGEKLFVVAYSELRNNLPILLQSGSN